MTGWLAAVRAVHFASGMLVFGELVFALFIAAPVSGSAWLDPSSAGEASRRRFDRVALWSIVVGIPSWLIWLGCETALMSGAPVAVALHGDTLMAVLGKTAFGRLWLVRVALAVVLAVLLWSSTQVTPGAIRRILTYAALAIAGVYLASLAWAGHAAAGGERSVQLASDAVHLLAAGAWLGALPALAAMLASGPGFDPAARATRRFSSLGVASVTALVCTGVVNAWYLVGDIPGLVGTGYGRLLLAKLALFAAMLALAAVNRLVLTPRLSTGGSAAASRLRRNALVETAFGAGIVAIVGVLGITIPAAHQSPVWPFSRGLDLEPAYPTSYATSPVKYTTAAIARGSALYAQQCSSCHGPLGHGDGSMAASLPVKPANVAEHAAFHRPGDLFWFVAHGVPDTPMRAFAATLSEGEIWSLVQFLRALSDSEAAGTMSGTASPARPIVAPDFTFEVPRQGQQSLARPRERESTLLVFYTLPQSLPRLQQLQADAQADADHAIRVIPVRMTSAAGAASSPQEAGPQAPAAERPEPMRAITGQDVPAVYAMFEHAPEGEGTADHVEFLVDAGGFLRRRWIGVPDDPRARTAEQLAQVEAIAREPPLAVSEKRHAH
ncbi:MAG TPA: copper homeostasis membrane protein CopD [Casimicrobiaceae bacterium]|nr:copper homeostasis membrane protein CopD [Casimicrobiaceae bacterium]